MLLHRSIRKCTPHLQLSPTTNPSLLNKTEQFWWYWRVTMAQSTYFTVHYIFWLKIVHYILEKLLYTGTVWRYLPFVIPTIPGVLIGDRQLSCLWQWWNHWGFVLPCFWLQPFMLDWTSGHRLTEWSEFSIGMVNHISHYQRLDMRMRKYVIFNLVLCLGHFYFFSPLASESIPHSFSYHFPLYYVFFL